MTTKQQDTTSVVKQVQKRPNLPKETVVKNFKELIDKFAAHNPPTFGRQFQALLNLTDVQYADGIVGKLIFHITIPETMRNGMGIGHGGAMASLLDDSTWAAAYAFTRREVFSVKLICEYLNPVEINKECIFEITVNKISRNLAFADAIIKDAKTHKPLVKGSNVMALPPEERVKL
eukprot:403347568